MSFTRLFDEIRMYGVSAMQMKELVKRAMATKYIWHYAFMSFRHDAWIKSFIVNLDSPPHTRVADIGCGSKPFRKSIVQKNWQYHGFDITSDSEHTHFDGLRVPSPDGTFDIVICTEVLEHAREDLILISECSRILKSNGLMIVAIPFMYPIHGEPNDFRRYSTFGIKKALEQEMVDIFIEKRFGGISSFAGFLLINFRFNFMKSNSRARRVLSLSIMTLFVLVTIISNIFSLVIQKIESQMYLYSIVVAVGRKSS